MFEQRAQQIEEILKKLYALANAVEEKLTTIGSQKMNASVFIGSFVQDVQRAFEQIDVSSFSETINKTLAEDLKKIKRLISDINKLSVNISVNPEGIAAARQALEQFRAELRDVSMSVRVRIAGLEALDRLNQDRESLRETIEIVRMLSHELKSIPSVEFNISGLAAFQASLREAASDVRALRAEIEDLNDVRARIRTTRRAPRTSSESLEERGSSYALDDIQDVSSRLDVVSRKYAKFNFAVSQIAGIFNSFREILLGFAGGPGTPEGALNIAGGIIGILRGIQTTNAYFKLGLLPKSVEGIFNQRRAETLADFIEAIIYTTIGRPERLQERRFRQWMEQLSPAEFSRRVTPEQFMRAAFDRGMIDKEEYEAFQKDRERRAKEAQQQERYVRTTPKSLRSRVVRDKKNIYGYSTGKLLRFRKGPHDPTTQIGKEDESLAEIDFRSLIDFAKSVDYRRTFDSLKTLAAKEFKRLSKHSAYRQVAEYLNVENLKQFVQSADYRQFADALKKRGLEELRRVVKETRLDTFFDMFGRDEYRRYTRLGKTAWEMYSKAFETPKEYTPDMLVLGPQKARMAVVSVSETFRKAAEQRGNQSGTFFFTRGDEGKVDKTAIYARTGRKPEEIAQTIIHEFTHLVTTKRNDELKFMKDNLREFSDPKLERIRKEALASFDKRVNKFWFTDEFKQWNERSWRQGISAKLDKTFREYSFKATEVLSVVADSMAAKGLREAFVRDFYGKELYEAAKQVLEQTEGRVYNQDFHKRYLKFVEDYSKVNPEQEDWQDQTIADIIKKAVEGAKKAFAELRI